MTGIEYLTSQQAEVLRDLAEPIAGVGDSDATNGALLIYVLPEAISQTWADGVTYTIAAGTWAREVTGGNVVAYRATEYPDADRVEAAGLDVTLFSRDGEPYTWEELADALAERDDA